MSKMSGVAKAYAEDRAANLFSHLRDCQLGVCGDPGCRCATVPADMHPARVGVGLHRHVPWQHHAPVCPAQHRILPVFRLDVFEKTLCQAYGIVVWRPSQRVEVDDLLLGAQHYDQSPVQTTYIKWHQPDFGASGCMPLKSPARFVTTGQHAHDWQPEDRERRNSSTGSRRQVGHVVVDYLIVQQSVAVQGGQASRRYGGSNCGY